jgi:pimeloyl-ACP methyl ester carboxylesterase
MTERARMSVRVALVSLLLLAVSAIGSAQGARPPRIVVFIHGLGGDATTWRADGTSLGWPEIVSQDPRLGRKSEVVAYDARICAGRITIKSAANEVLKTLRARKVFRSESVAFVSHSLGGLVARELYLQLTGDERGRVSDVFLIASPSQGASVANVPSLFCSGSLATALKNVNDNVVLQDLNDRWDDLRGLMIRQNRHFPRVHCAYEARRTKGVLVVQRKDAVIGCDERLVAFDEDHLSIVKPSSRDARIHQWLRGWLLEGDKIPNDTGRRLILEILQQTYRRAFALDMTSRFASNKDFDAVYESIASAQREVQMRAILVSANTPEYVGAIVQSLLKQLEGLTITLRGLQRYVVDGSVRLDGANESAFLDMCSLEHKRLAVLSTLEALAKSVDYRSGVVPPALVVDPRTANDGRVFAVWCEA